MIDGALIPWEIIPPLKIQEQTKYQIEGADKERFGTTVFQVSMNKGTLGQPAGRRQAGLPGCIRS